MNFMDVTFRHLEIFVAIVKNGNIKRASKELFLSQSAISMGLSDMEARLGVKLFDRVNKKLILNKYGEQVFVTAQNILKKIEELSKISNQETLSGNLKLGATQTIGNYVIPYLIGDFKSKNPNVDIMLFVENTEQIMNKLLNFQVDVAFVEGIVLSNEVDSIPWIEDEIIVFSSPNYHLAEKSNVTIDELENEKWVLREKGSGTRDIFERYMYDKITKMNIYLEIGHTEAIKKIVESGIGLGSLSKLTVKRELDAGLLKKIDLPFQIKRNFKIVFHKKKYKTRLLNEFVSFSQSFKI